MNAKAWAIGTVAILLAAGAALGEHVGDPGAGYSVTRISTELLGLQGDFWYGRYVDSWLLEADPGVQFTRVTNLTTGFFQTGDIHCWERWDLTGPGFEYPLETQDVELTFAQSSWLWSWAGGVDGFNPLPAIQLPSMTTSFMLTSTTDLEGAGKIYWTYVRSMDVETSPVPEPGTLGLFALGGLGVLLRRRKSKA